MDDTKVFTQEQKTESLRKALIEAGYDMVEKPHNFDPFGQTRIAHLGYNMIDPLKSW